MANIIFYINCFIFFQFLVFSLFAHVVKSKNKNIRILSLVLVTPNVSFCIGAMKFSTYHLIAEHLFFIEISFYALASILYYLYLNYILTDKLPLKKIVCHTAPLALFILAFAVLAIVSPSDYQAVLAFRNKVNVYFEWDVVIAFVYTFAYAVLSKIEINIHKNRLRKAGQFSSKKFKWIDIFTWFIISFSFLAIVSELTSSILGLCMYLYMVIYVFFILSTSFVVIRQSSYLLYSNAHKKAPSIHTAKEETESKITSKIQAEKIYLNKDLTLNVFANSVGMAPHVLSDFIRAHYNKNFNQFINAYRIREAQALLTNPENNQFTIDAIGEMCGFSSRSNFYTVFKKETGNSPFEFRKNNQK